MEHFYVTTPIYYVNAHPHIGHAYTTIAADVLARYYRQNNVDVCFVTGTDEHGQKIDKEAQKKGVSPQSLVDEVSQTFSDLWTFLGIEYNHFIRTTDPSHVSYVQKVLTTLYEKDQIYLDFYEGLYCVPCESFIPEGQLIDESCPDCRNPVEKIREETYFFKLAQHQDWLVDVIKNNDLVYPLMRQNEVLSMLKEPLSDLCISRPRKRLSWGIPLPFDVEHVTYVWFDALINYISILSSHKKTDSFWPCDVHLIGKDILRPHAIFWPIMLKALDLELPRKIVVHGWWTVAGEKMSKSKGNALDPYDVVSMCGKDAFRYFILRELPFGEDGVFSFERLASRVNAELANDFGNFVSRVLGMLLRYCEGEIPPYPKKYDSIEKSIEEKYLSSLEGYDCSMKSCQFSLAIESAMQYIRIMNRYVEQTAPWKLSKDVSQQERLCDIMSYLVQAIGRMTHFMSPFVPELSHKIEKHFGFNFRENHNFILSSETKITPSKPFFPRIEYD